MTWKVDMNGQFSYLNKVVRGNLTSFCSSKYLNVDLNKFNSKLTQKVLCLSHCMVYSQPLFLCIIVQATCILKKRVTILFFCNIKNYNLKPSYFSVFKNSVPQFFPIVLQKYDFSANHHLLKSTFKKF